MKPYRSLILILVGMVFPVAASAATMSSPGYNISSAAIVSGGGSASDAAGMSASGTAIGTPLYLPATVISGSPNYTVKKISQVAPGGGGGFLHTGDINGDGAVDVIDALLALKAGIGLMQLSAAELTRGDVGPLQRSVPVGNGIIDIEDTMLILRKAVGLGW